VEELVGSLQTYELNFKAPTGKSIALKSSKNISQENNRNSDLENSEDDMALLAKKFYKIFKSKKRVDFQKSNDKRRYKSKTKTWKSLKDSQCYNCQEYEHLT
ncbi:hypothetical protein PJP10_31595, partial [Mycobacterium kansasii]